MHNQRVKYYNKLLRVSLHFLSSCILQVEISPVTTFGSLGRAETLRTMSEAVEDSRSLGTTRANPWRGHSAADLRTRTIVFPAQCLVKQADYIAALLAEGVPSAEILSIQVSTGSECRLSLSDITLLEKLVINGFLLHKERVFPSPFEKKTIQIHIHDLPIWIPNCVVEN